jgi:transposase-like protein
MLDGIDLKGRCCVVALGVGTDGVKVPLGLWDGSTENKRVSSPFGGEGRGASLDLIAR